MYALSRRSAKMLFANRIQGIGRPLAVSFEVVKCYLATSLTCAGVFSERTTNGLHQSPMDFDGQTQFDDIPWTRQR